MKMQEKILVVDDDPNLRKTLADILRVKGYETVNAGTGVEAIAAAEREHFSLALIDLMLPDMPGLEVMTRIKAFSPLTEAIILTGHASLDTAIEATKKGAFSYILKPYQMDDLLRDIQHGIERQRAQVDIRRLSEALRQTQQAIVVADAALHFEYINQAFTRLLGYSLEDVAGQSLNLMSVPDSTPAPTQTAAVAVEKGQFVGEVRRRAKDGTLVPILLNISPIIDEQGKVLSYVATMTDLTESKRMEASLRESEEKFRSIGASAKDAIIMLDENGRISFWNAAAETIFGYSSKEVYGKDLHGLLAPVRFHQAFLEGFAKFRDTGQGEAVGKTLELAAIRKGGVEFPMEISLSAVSSKGKWLAIGIIRDISERKSAEAKSKAILEELGQSNHALKELNGKLEQTQNQLLQSEKMASIGLLAAGVAHEINNPIGYIQSNLGTLGNYIESFLAVLDAYEKVELSAPDRKELFAEVQDLKKGGELAYLKQDVIALLTESQSGIDRVKTIVQNLKDFSHSDTTEKWMIEDIHKGLDSTLNVIWNELKYNCEVVKEYGVLPPVECLISQLNQVFMNLLINAAQAIETKGTITIRTRTKDGQVWIEIADTGKGIPPENLSRIFDPFFTTKPVGKGTGLGLSVSFSIIQKHHGKLEVESTPGKGTLFKVILPVKQMSSENIDLHQ
ncbi:MAG: PAS domain S-box protein [Gammaproteobacteria bacterium]|nr:PAS domain S-box protein [Gammaproteobacteria bacterium]